MLDSSLQRRFCVCHVPLVSLLLNSNGVVPCEFGPVDDPWWYERVWESNMMSAREAKVDRYFSQCKVSFCCLRRITSGVALPVMCPCIVRASQ